MDIKTLIFLINFSKTWVLIRMIILFKPHVITSDKIPGEENSFINQSSLKFKLKIKFNLKLQLRLNYN